MAVPVKTGEFWLCYAANALAKAQDFDFDLGDAGFQKAELFRCPFGQVEQAAIAGMGATVDANVDAALIIEIDDSQTGAEGQVGVSCRQAVFIVGLATSGALSMQLVAVI